MISYFCPDVSNAGSPLRFILKDADTFNIAALTVTWRGFVLLVVPNCFHSTNSDN